MVEKDTISKNEEIEWVSTLNDEYYTENRLEKLKRKCKENPLVPIGLCATIGALSYGLYNFYFGSKMKQQYGMRARVMFQGVTLAAISYSMYSEGKKRIQQKKMEKEKAEENKKARS